MPRIELIPRKGSTQLRRMFALDEGAPVALMLKEGYAYTLDVKMREHPESHLPVPHIMGDGGTANLSVESVAWSPSDNKKAADVSRLTMSARQGQRAMIGRARAKAETVLKHTYGDGYASKQTQMLRDAGESEEDIIKLLVTEANEHMVERERIDVETMGVLDADHEGVGVRKVTPEELEEIESRVCHTGRDGSDGGVPAKPPCGRLFESEAKRKNHWRSKHNARSRAPKRRLTNYEETVL